MEDLQRKTAFVTIYLVYGFQCQVGMLRGKLIVE